MAAHSPRTLGTGKHAARVACEQPWSVRLFQHVLRWICDGCLGSFLDLTLQGVAQQRAAYVLPHTQTAEHPYPARAVLQSPSALAPTASCRQLALGLSTSGLCSTIQAGSRCWTACVCDRRAAGSLVQLVLGLSAFNPEMLDSQAKLEHWEAMWAAC